MQLGSNSVILVACYHLSMIVTGWQDVSHVLLLKTAVCCNSLSLELCESRLDVLLLELALITEAYGIS